MTELVKLEIDQGVATVTLNRPNELNALSKELSLGIIDAITAAECDSAVSVIVLTGSGKAFCAGVDLKELSEGGDLLRDDQAFLQMFIDGKKPLIGAINGFAITGGLELALNCDFLYAADTAKFADTHSKVGLMPAWGMSQKLPRLIGVNRALEMSLSGRFIDASTARDWGLVNRVFPAEVLLAETQAIAREIAQNETVGCIAIRQVIKEGWQQNLEQGMQIEQIQARTHNDAMDMSGMLERLNQVRKR